MSRTRRQKIPRAWRKPGLVPDGTDLRPSRGCRNHGSCAYCANGRTHSNRRRAPIEE